LIEGLRIPNGFPVFHNRHPENSVKPLFGLNCSI
jgi:hypothetical protein